MSDDDDHKPDLLFGIDMGMSCTGVAYVNRAIGSDTVKTFTDWDYRNCEEKVPTQLLYEHGKLKPVAWGFGCDPEATNHQGKNLVQCFKVGLGDPKSSEEDQILIKRYFEDYLECLYNNLRTYFAAPIMGGVKWDEATIDFYFSVPTTWDAPTRRIFRQLANDAGFGRKKSFRAFTRLNEPLAVAAHAMMYEGFKKDDIVLIIDAGGGTVDLCFLKIDDENRSTASMSEIAPVKGELLGSTYIDAGLEEIAKTSLEHLDRDGQLMDPVEEIVSRMRSRLQPNKHNFKSGQYGDNGIFKIRIPGIRNKVNDPSINVIEGQMRFKWKDLQIEFDKQIDGINDMIDKMMDKFRISKHTRNQKVDYVFLSGGLGKSKYVQARIQAHLNTGKHKPLTDAVLRVSGDPQLCVCRGLIVHATKNIFPNRLASESFGIVFRMPLKVAEKHKKFKAAAKFARSEKGKQHVTEENGVEWMNDCVEWFVRVGETITEATPIQKPYGETIDPNSTVSTRSTKCNIVTSQSGNLPLFNDPRTSDVRFLESLQVNLSGIKLTQEKPPRFLFKRGEQPWKARFIIEAEIGPAEVNFRAVEPDSKRQISKSLAIPTDHVERPSLPHQSISKPNMIERLPTP